VQHQSISHDQPVESFPARKDRHVTVLVNAAISQRGRVGICRIRNISAEGMAIETSLPLKVGEEATVMLSSGREAECLVRWVRDGRAGMSCSSDLTALLIEDRAERLAPRPGPALPRFSAPAEVAIRMLGRSHRCVLDSISTSDVLLYGAPVLDLHQRLSVVVHGLGTFAAVASIWDKGNLFARFTPPLPFRQLDEWLAGLA
jgi:hypothetical protein